MKWTNPMGKYKHKEAFCLMHYACEESGCRHQELIWNSRDGVTPFGTTCPSCGGTMTHILWRLDRCTPDHKLHKGQKFWRDGTKEEAIKIIKARHAAIEGTEWEKIVGKGEEQLEALEATYGEPDSEFPKGWPMLDVYMGETK